MLLLLSLVISAPVPQGPRGLTSDMLLGKWEYLYSAMEDGWIVFGADGMYASRHRPGDVPEWYVVWWVDGCRITILEGPLATRYEFDLSLRGWPTLEGTSNGGCRVRLRRLPKE